MTARILDVSVAQYHADPCPTPSLSASLAKVLIDQSPRHAYAAHPRMGGLRREPTDAMDRGTLGHRLLLGKGADVEELHFADFRTNACKEQRDAARAAGRIPVLSHALAEALEMTDAHRQGLAAYGVHLTGDSEVAFAWEERVFCADVTIQARCMMDHVIVSDGVIFDVKIVASANPEVCAKNMSSYGYDVQHAAYTSCLRSYRPELSGRERMVFLFCESEPPYVVQPIVPDGQFKALGQARWDRAVRTWHECMKSGRWPGYSDQVVTVSPAVWALNREMSFSASEGESTP